MTRSPYVVVIVDDHELFAQGLALLLTREWGELFTVGGQTTYVEEAADLVARCDADVAIIDLSMPPLGGVAAIRHIKARHPKTRILALSGTDDLGLAEEALRAGADGFLPKTARPEALAGPLWTIAEGLRVIDGALLDALLSNTRKPPSELLDSLQRPGPSAVDPAGDRYGDRRHRPPDAGVGAHRQTHGGRAAAQTRGQQPHCRCRVGRPLPAAR